MKALSNLIILSIVTILHVSCVGSQIFIQNPSSDLAPYISISELNKASSSAEIVLKVEFKNPVTGFEQSDLIFEGGEIQSFSGSGKSYTFKIMTATNTFTAQVLSGAALTKDGRETVVSNLATYVFRSETTVYGSCFDVTTLTSKYQAIGM